MSYAHTDEDVLETEWVKGSGFKKVTFNLPKGKKIRVRFVTDPASMALDHGWCAYREVTAYNGLVGGYDLPNGMREIPVDDFEVIVDPEDGKRKKRAKRDPIAQRVRPGKFDLQDGRSFASASDKVIGNVIYIEGNLEKKTQYDPAPGTHILLKFSKSAFQDILTTFATYRDADVNFDPTAATWDLLVDGTPTRLIITRVKGEPPVDDLPDPLDTVVWVNDLRKAVEKAVEEIDAAAEGTMLDPDGDGVVEEEGEILEDFVAAHQTDTVHAESGVDWSDMPPATIKRKLAALKPPVSVPAGISRPDLIELAKQHL